MLIIKRYYSKTAKQGPHLLLHDPKSLSILRMSLSHPFLIASVSRLMSQKFINFSNKTSSTLSCLSNFHYTKEVDPSLQSYPVESQLPVLTVPILLCLCQTLPRSVYFSTRPCLFLELLCLCLQLFLKFCF